MSGNAFVDHYRKLVVFWSPKCACTAVASWFENGVLSTNPCLKNIRNKKSINSRKWLIDNGYLYNYIQAWHLIKEFNYYSVQFTRHPASRLVSAYINKFVTYQGKSLSSLEHLEPFSRKVVRQIYLAKGWEIDNYRGIRFIDLIEYLEEKMIRIPKSVSGESLLDPHWDTQLPRRYETCVEKADFIVHQESFDLDLKSLNTNLSINFIPKKENSSKFISSEEYEGLLSEKFSSEINDLDVKLKPDNFLDIDILQRLKTIYKIDYEYFKYNPFELQVNQNHEVAIQQDISLDFLSKVKDSTNSIASDFQTKSKILLIAFGGLADKLDIPPFEFFKLTTDPDFPVINKMFVRDFHQAWYQKGLPEVGESIDEVVTFISSEIEKRGISRVITVGTSAGGYAALLFGCLLNADEVLAFGPQTFIDSQNREFYQDDRWMPKIKTLYQDLGEEMKYFDLSLTLQDFSNNQTKFKIYFDCTHSLDNAHASHIKNCNNVQLIPYEEGGHSIVKMMRDRGILKSILLDSLR